jgi:hypothetical protein
MATAFDRTERYSKIRTLLGFPMVQHPSPHSIFNQMLITQQTMNLRLTNTGRPWNIISKELATVADTSTYEIEQPVALYQNSGKVHFVIRTTGDTNLPYIEIPFDDFSDQRYGQMPPNGIVNSSLMAPEKITFYRTNIQDQIINAVITPTPQEVLTYTIWFFVGALDRSHALTTNVPGLPELADYEDIQTAALLLADSRWKQDDKYNAAERINRSASLAAQMAILEPIVDQYIKDINSPKSFDMGHWND